MKTMEYQRFIVCVIGAMFVLEPKMAGTYVRYPYLAFHSNRAPR